MSTASASSLVLPSLNPKTIYLYNPKPTSLSFLSFSTCLKFHPKSVSISSTIFYPLSSRFVRNVTVSSEFDQEEEVFGNGEASSFSPDLKLFVGNLPFSVDSAQLVTLFETARNVQMVEVTGRSRGFGFVTISTAEEVEVAAQLFNGYEFQGRPLRVNSGPPPPRREESFPRGPRGGGFDGGNHVGFDGGNHRDFNAGNHVYVGNLSWGVDDLPLETLFREQGKVLEAKVV